MALTILPRKSDPNGTAEAQAKLKAEIENPFSAVMIVLGEGLPINKVVEVGTARASLAPLRRSLVWAPDTAVLTPKQLKNYSPKGEVSAFVGLDNEVSTRLKLAQSQIPFFVEEAFTNAGG